MAWIGSPGPLGYAAWTFPRASPSLVVSGRLGAWRPSVLPQGYPVAPPGFPELLPERASERPETALQSGRGRYNWRAHVRTLMSWLSFGGWPRPQIGLGAREVYADLSPLARLFSHGPAGYSNSSLPCSHPRSSRCVRRTSCDEQSERMDTG